MNTYFQGAPDAQQVASSLVNSGAVVSFGGYVKPKAVDL